MNPTGQEVDIEVYLASKPYADHVRSALEMQRFAAASGLQSVASLLEDRELAWLSRTSPVPESFTAVDD